MIEKSEADAAGIGTIDCNSGSREQKLIEQLKALLPHVINSDNQLNVQALQELIDPAQTTSNNYGYELTFAGKGIAKAEASEETEYELQVELKQSKNFERTNNMVLRGDNIDVLKILKANYHSKIKMIYIDPPYNTKSAEFIYNDNFKKNEAELIETYGLNEKTIDFLHNVYSTKSHSGWLSFMYPRLKIARELLRDDGVIFISIDDNEQANLKIMCDEIFGEENFVAEITVINNKAGVDYGHISKTHEYLLIYQKTQDSLMYKISDKNKKFKYYGKKESFDLVGLRHNNIIFNKFNRPNLYYPFYINPKAKDKNNFYAFSLEQKEGYIAVYPYQTRGIDGVWRWGKDRAKEMIDDIVIVKNSFGEYRVNQKYKSNMQPIKSVWDDKDFRTERGNRSIMDIFQNKVFSFSKPDLFIKKILNISTKDNDIILDFFAGSGTTGDAVMQLNAEDGGNRQYILVQIDEKIDEKKNKEAYDFCTNKGLEPVISSICIERLHRSGEKLQQEYHGKHSVDIGYKVFTLKPKPRIIQDKQSIFKIDHERSSSLNTLYNMLCATCKALHLPIKEVIKDTLYICDNEVYILAKVSQEVLEKYRDYKINLNAYADIQLKDFLNLRSSENANISVVW